MFKNKMKEIYNGIIGSFDNQPRGFSSRKLTAFILTLMVVITHIKWLISGDFSQMEMVLTIDFAFIASLFGMTTYQSLKSQPKTIVDKIEPVVEPVVEPIIPDADKI